MPTLREITEDRFHSLVTDSPTVRRAIAVEESFNGLHDSGGEISRRMVAEVRRRIEARIRQD